MDSTTKCIAFMLLSEGAEKLSRAQITEYAQRLGVTTRTIYRYMDKIWKAKFYLKNY